MPCTLLRRSRWSPLVVTQQVVDVATAESRATSAQKPSARESQYRADKRGDQTDGNGAQIVTPFSFTRDEGRREHSYPVTRASTSERRGGSAPARSQIIAATRTPKRHSLGDPFEIATSSRPRPCSSQ